MLTHLTLINSFQERIALLQVLIILEIQGSRLTEFHYLAVDMWQILSLAFSTYSPNFPNKPLTEDMT